MNTKEKRNALYDFCMSKTGVTCSKCVLGGEKHRCGRGVHFTTTNNAKEYEMTDEEINVAYDLVFPKVKEAQEVKEVKDTDTDTPHIKDSGERREFASGAVRDIQKGKGRCDLLPLDVVEHAIRDYSSSENCEDVADIIHLIHEFQMDGCPDHLLECLAAFDGLGEKWSTIFLEVAKHYEEGADKYGEYNWQRGLPTQSYINSAIRHYLKWFRGDKDEPHDRAFVWNIMCCIWTCKHKPELNSYPRKEQEDGKAD